MKKGKFLSSLAAVALSASMLFAPAGQAFASQPGDTPDVEVTETAEKTTKSVTIHKILQTKENMNKKDEKGNDIFPGTTGINGDVYNGEAITNITGFFGDTAKPINDVYFAWAKKDGDTYYWINDEGNFVLQNDQKVKADPDNTENLPEGTKGGLTKDDGSVKFDNLSTFEGEYAVYEIQHKSPYYSLTDEDKAKKLGAKFINGTKAVPLELVLPFVNDNDVQDELHVYPKNTEDRPKVDKNFDGDEGTDNRITSDELKNKEKEYNGRPVVADEEKTNVDTNVDNNQRNKGIVSKNIGDTVPYKIETEIPAGATYKVLQWHDNMGKGLTYDKNVKITVNGNVLTEGTDYTVEDSDRGFSLVLTEAGTDKVETAAATKAASIVLRYTAHINSEVEIDVNQENQLEFVYDNYPGFNEVPPSVQPNENGELKVNKTWDDGQWAPQETATFELRDAETGELVTADDLVRPDNITDDEWNTIVSQFQNTVTIGYDAVNGKTHTWKGLDPNKEYRAVETNFTDGTGADYKPSERGQVNVEDRHYPEDRPGRPGSIKPSPVHVVTHGVKFVKTSENETERLAGAQFTVTNAKGQFLTYGDNTQAQAEYEQLNKDYFAAIEAYNRINKLAALEEPTEEETKELKGLLDTWNATLQQADLGTIAIDENTQNIEEATKPLATLVERRLEARNDSFVEARSQYGWADADAKGNRPANAVILTSDEKGRFEIKGLEEGKYTFTEIEAPDGYAIPTNNKTDVDVTVGTYSKGDINYELDSEDKDATRIENRKVTIPQTGGIGSLIFIVAGLAIMGIAFAMRRRNSVEA